MKEAFYRFKTAYLCRIVRGSTQKSCIVYLTEFVVFQSLLLLSYLLRNGSERVVTSARDHIYDMRQLEDYQHIDEHGRDQGINSQ